MARRATEVQSLRSGLPNVLVVDTGGSLTGAQTGTGALSDRLYAQVLASLHYDAVNAGPGELLAAPAALGPDNLRGLILGPGAQTMEVADVGIANTIRPKR